MASIQQLEKLYNLQRYFQREDDSLEGIVASERIGHLIQRTEQLLRQLAFLREERRTIRLTSERILERNAALEKMKRTDWLPKDINTKCIEKKVILNISGMTFEIPYSILNRDPASLLHQLTQPNPPILIDPDGCYYFERDWWIFRYILMFLRDGILPDDRQLLSQMYREAAFWNLIELQRGIEAQKLHLIAEPPSEKEEITKTKKWWEELPSWLQAVQEKENEEKEKKKKESEQKKDWWKDTSYDGRTYLPLSTDPLKVVTKAGEKDELKLTSSYTWRAQSRQNSSTNRFGYLEDYDRGEY